MDAEAADEAYARRLEAQFQRDFEEQEARDAALAATLSGRGSAEVADGVEADAQLALQLGEQEIAEVARWERDHLASEAAAKALDQELNSTERNLQKSDRDVALRLVEGTQSRARRTPHKLEPNFEATYPRMGKKSRPAQQPPTALNFEPDLDEESLEELLSVAGAPATPPRGLDHDGDERARGSEEEAGGAPRPRAKKSRGARRGAGGAKSPLPPPARGAARLYSHEYLEFLRRQPNWQKSLPFVTDGPALNAYPPRHPGWPIVFYEMVASLTNTGLDHLSKIPEDLDESICIIMDASRFFSPSRRLRIYLTNLRIHMSAENWAQQVLKLPQAVTVDGRVFKVAELVRKYAFVPVPGGGCRELSAGEAEKIMGFPKGYTRMNGHARNPDALRRKMLGNSFQVDNVAYLLHPLQDMQRRGELPLEGIVVLSLFDGIGGALMALTKLGVRVRLYITSEKNKACEAVVERFIRDKAELIQGRSDPVPIEQFWVRLGDILPKASEGKRPPLSELDIPGLVAKHGIHLVIGGSPCNNLTMSNRQPSTSASGPSGFNGQDSKLFTEFEKGVRKVREAYRDLRMRGSSSAPTAA
ncbi:hypothetical protein WJX73_009854 [Symbiochloris irregularis]|uniref:Uncharacterized protein n=1 Tax=Symbiochloris irregularis TaxID=706552 RepID=A0AAW1NU24_9CHLO